MIACVSALAVALALVAAPAAHSQVSEAKTMTNPEAGLVAHWPFRSDCADHAPHGVQGTARNVAIAAEGGAQFDGASSCIEVASHPALDFAKGDFSIALRVHTEKETTDVVGDILSKYDPERRRGITLSVVSNCGVTSTAANDRNIQFGIDDGRSDPAWVDCGRPGAAKLIAALTVFDGDLYAGTFEWGADEAGHVWRYAGEGRWVDCGSPAPCNMAHVLVVHDGALYCGVNRYKAGGSCLPDSPNTRPGGKVFRYEGGRRWTDCGQLDDGWGIHCMTSFNGTLYATPIYQHFVYAYRGGATWEKTGPDARVMAMGVWNGHLYALTSGRDAIYRMDAAGRWEECVRLPNVSQYYSFAVYQGRPCIGTWPLGEVFRWNEDGQWNVIGSPGYTKEVMGMAIYNSRLYAGVLPMAQVYRYEKDLGWTLTGTVDNTPNVPLRRAWTMAVFNGRLYCGTLPSGHVMSFEAGKVASVDRRLAPGWRHIAAVRAGERLRVYVDGNLAGESTAFAPEDYDVSNDAPLRIGFGAHDYFKGRMSDLRIYNRALSAQEISALVHSE